jgi:N-acetylmuramoyl-L-alanine amidase
VRPISEIIIHCTATRPEWRADDPTSAKVAEVRRWHVEDRGWKDIGYHFLIDRDGTVAKGRPLEQVGAHVQGHNTGTIGVSLIGGHGSSADDPFERHFTTKQDKALRKLIADLRKQFPAITKVTGHNQYANKACPGFQVSRWLAPTATPPRTSTPVAASDPGSGARQSPLVAFLRWLVGLFVKGKT